MFMIMYWAFRVIVVLMSQLGRDFVVVPLNTNFEIILLFVFLFMCYFGCKKKSIGCNFIFSMLWSVFFGADIADKMKLLTNGDTLTMAQMSSLFFSIKIIN